MDISDDSDFQDDRKSAISIRVKNNEFTCYEPIMLTNKFQNLDSAYELLERMKTKGSEKDMEVVASLDLEDEKLLEEDNLGPQDSKRSRHHNKAGPWLKKTEYISTEFNRYGVSNDKTETKVGYNVKKLFKEENLYMDRESQINAINKTFEDAQKPIEKHCSKPGVYPLEVLPLFPDFERIMGLTTAL
ncbi:RNA polymerase II-associated factor 1 homolog isoform X4 [Tachypleus tridentatus]|uniref:RNA polymerase II-associated factor 1 homolog isoform X4 n=1 Tax=Tachypleus tridentatus TaxID=6853 RepID=UPI003FD51F48